jgi:gamma-glutamyl:cysteine ligase YbdK (ATP-grasp superfamily)
MAMNETTRQVNLRAIDALEAVKRKVHEVDLGVLVARWPLEELSRYTNAHDEVFEHLQGLRDRIAEVDEDLARRIKAESEGTRR